MTPGDNTDTVPARSSLRRPADRIKGGFVIKKVIVIGLDGLEPAIVGPMLDLGELPNLASLRQRGGWAKVATTSPAQTPVAWSSFATGTNPGGHGIFDFVRRNPANYLPDIALNRYEQKNAFLPPKVVNLRRGRALWEVLCDAGVSSTVLRCPCTYPADRVQGRVLSGMGVPDLRGGLGTGTFFSTATRVTPGESEQVAPIEPDGSGGFSTALIGPRSPKDRSDVRLPITLRPNADDGSLAIRCEGGTGELVVRLGQWSDWLRLKFKLGMLQSARGMVRFHLVRLAPEMELYASPINFDPESPLFDISAPSDYAAELARHLGPYHTTGMVEDHNALSNGRIDEAAFLAQCDDAWKEREAMMLAELNVLEEGFFYCLFETPDRIQHMFWRFREPDHPANLGKAPSIEWRGVIEDAYRRADAMVGKALAFADDQTLFLTLSDHGFNSFRRGVNLNSWLLENGWLALRAGLDPGEEAGDLLRGVDWTRTRAYALGLSGIYLNLQGREAEGIVAPANAEAVRAEIARGLRKLVDPASGTVAITGALPREELYRGPFAGESPDLMVHCAPGYRIGWGSSLGGIPRDLFEDNVKPWAGDHIIDPSFVPGVLFMDRPFRNEGARLIDLAPTILEALGVPRGSEMEGSSLLP
ncbi:hypothetical protein BH23PLA1_BH23PLA1_06650 [soil metagenome]